MLKRTTKYDQATKKTITLGQRLLGKIVKGTTEMVPTRAKRLGVPKHGMTKEQLRLEKGLADWIRGRSTVDIFDWFDCIETTEVKTESGKFRWSTESIRRDTLFLERIGVVKPVAQAAAATSPAAGAAQEWSCFQTFRLRSGRAWIPAAPFTRPVFIKSGLNSARQKWRGCVMNVDSAGMDGIGSRQK